MVTVDQERELHSQIAKLSVSQSSQYKSSTELVSMILTNFSISCCFTGSRNGSNCGCLLEHLKSSGTKVMMSRPIACQLCGKKQKHDEFHVFFYTAPFFALPVYYLSEVFKAHLGVLL